MSGIANQPALADLARPTRGGGIAAEANRGGIELATQAETDAGTDDARAVTPLKLTAFPGILSRSYLAGLGLSNGTDATNDINIAVGEARSTADDANLVVATAIGKRIDADWVAGGTTGTPTGGISSSLTLANDTWYHMILGLVSGAVEVGFDTSITGANLVIDHSFTNTRRIGAVRRGTSTNLAFAQIGDEFLWDDPPLDIDVTDQGVSALTRTLTVPLGVKVRAEINVLVTHGSSLALLYVRSPDQNDEAPSVTAGPMTTINMVSTTQSDAGRAILLTGTSSDVTTRADQTSVTVRIATLGYIDRRGRDD